MGQMRQRQTMWGNKILGTVDEEVERLVNNSYLVAKQIVTENRDLLEHLTQKLMDQEVVSAEEFQMMLIEFKSKTIDYKVLGEERNREALPFQKLPASV
jgi:cell division protease FtsH